MDSKNELKKIILEIKSGKLGGAIRYLEEQLDNNDSNKVPLNILISLSLTTNSSNIVEDVELKNIMKLVFLCYKNISNPTEKEIMDYYRSLYYIFKYVKNELSLQDLTSLCSYIIPDWLEASLTIDIIEILYSFNTCVDKDTIMNHITNKDVTSLIKLFKLNIKISKLSFKKQQNILFQKIRWSIFIFHQNIDFKYFNEFCDFIFTIIDNLDLTLLNFEGYNELFLTLLSLVSNNLDHSGGKNDTAMLEKSFKKMKVCYKSSELEVCAGIMTLFYKNFVTKNFFNSNLNELIQLREYCDSILDKFQLSRVVFRTFATLTENILSRISFFDTAKQESWVPLNPVLLEEYIKVFDLIGRVVKHDKFVHKCQNDNCTIDVNYNQAFTVASLGATILNLSLRYECYKNLENLNDSASCAMQRCLRYISSMKSNNCYRWAHNWRLLGTLMFNIGRRYYQIENFTLARFYFKMLVSHILKFEGFVQSGNYLITENVLSNTLNLIANSYSRNQNYKNALIYLVFGLLYQPDEPKHWSNWMNVKFKANSSDVGNIYELTTKDILEQNQDMLKQIYPDFTTTENDLGKLLFLELKSYTTLWPSKIPIKNTANQFFCLCTDPFLVTEAFCLSWEKTRTIQDESYAQKLDHTILQLSTKMDLKSQICLSVLLFIEYNLKNYEVFKKNLSQMNEEAQETSTKPKPDPDAPEPNDRYDINPTYTQNKIENNLTLAKILYKVTDLWAKIFSDPSIHNFKDTLLSFNLPDLVKTVVFEFRVQLNRYKMLEIWFLSLKLGEILDQKDLILCSTGFILENIDLREELAKKLEEKVLIFLRDPKILAETKATFYVNKSVGCLRSDLLCDGLTNFFKAKGVLGEVPEGPRTILKARLGLLENQYLQKSCSLKLMPHDENYIIAAHDSFGCIAEYYKKGGSKCLYTLSILFEISYNIGKMYKSLRMPRELRYYTCEAVLLAQKIVLPMQTALFFSLLGFTDLLGHHFDDCRVKISGIDHILGNQNNYGVKNHFYNNLDAKLVEVNKGIQNLNLSISTEVEVMLEVPDDHKIKNLQGSPILKGKSFIFPNFIYHLDCACLYCTNLDYLRLILEVAHLQVSYYTHNNELEKATEFFKGAQRIYKGILKKYQSKKLNSELLNFFKSHLNRTYSELCIDYAMVYAKKNLQEQGLQHVNDIFEIMEEALLYENCLRTELIYCKMNFLSAIQLNQEAMDIIFDVPLSDHSDMEVCLIKTPENKVSVVKFQAVRPSNEPDPHKRQLRKELKFDLNDNENETKPKTESYKLQVDKTPAPKIKIYTPLTDNKIKPLCMPVSPNEAPQTSKSRLKFPSLSKSPKNELKADLPIINAPQSSKTRLKSKRLLDKNTKILTEKLKMENEANKMEPEMIDKVEKPEKKSAARGRKKNETKTSIPITKAKENVAIPTRKGSSSGSSKGTLESKRVHLKERPTKEPKTSSVAIKKVNPSKGETAQRKGSSSDLNNGFLEPRKKVNPSKGTASSDGSKTMKRTTSVESVTATSQINSVPTKRGQYKKIMLPSSSSTESLN